MWVPTSRIGCSSRTLRRAMRRSRASRIASAISLAPTEPNSLPPSSARCSIVSTVLESSEAGCSSRSAPRLSAFLAGGRRRGGGGELAGDQVIAQITGGDVDRFAAPAEAVHVLEQDRLGHRGLSAPRRRAAGRSLAPA